MALSKTPRRLLQRVGAVVLTVVAAPVLIALGSVDEDLPIRVGEPAPRTVTATETIRVVDEDATENARRVAAESVEPVVVVDSEARAGIVNDVSAVFEAVRQAREPVVVTDAGGVSPTTAAETETRVPPVDEQVEALTAQIDVLDAEALRLLASMSDSRLRTVESSTLEIARNLARLRFTSDELEQTVEEFLRQELSILDLGDDEIEDQVVAPLIRGVAQATEQVDPDATQAARQRAAESVDEVVQIWEPGDEVVTAGQRVEPLEFQALEDLGVEGSGPWRSLLRAFAVMLLATAVIAGYLWRMQPRVWRSGRKVLLLAAIVTGYAALTAAIAFVTGSESAAWWYAAPAPALAMLAAIMVHPVVGIAMMLPAVMLVLLTAPMSSGVAVFVAAAVVLSVPLVTELMSRGDLRRATMRVALAMPAIAALTVAVFGPRDQFVVAVAAAALNGVGSALLVQGLLPFLETLFRLPTVTALLDLADRNHPLLRELEAKAIGSYNHSVMVASLVERACREIGARPLLGSVAALYHDIGKVRRPHFFIENQRGIGNPHDELEPEVSAIIIQEHVVDGVKMAREYRLPPEVVACIGSHHGTMLVTYFYRKAVEAAGDERLVDESTYRYKGTKPRSKEAAVLLIADCCEATTRAMAMDRGTLPREDIESTVDRLLHERVEDGQFDECDLTFDEMRRVRDSIVDALVGIYHPRIAYPAARSAQEEPAPVAAND